MANKYACASGLWSATSTWSDSDAVVPGASVPADGDAVFIGITGQSGISVKMDTDLSGYTGLLTVTIRGGSTPSMLYAMDGTSGILKIRTGYNLVGTTDTNRGRLLANSDGVWGNTGSLAFADKFIISLQGTSKLDATDMDIALYDTEPTTKIVRTYGTKYTLTDAEISIGDDTLDLGTTPPSAGTPVMITTIGTLPGGLMENHQYYVRSVSGDTCKLATQNSDAQIVDLTSTGSGTFTVFTGYDAGSATVNVLEDVTSDTPWVTTAGHNACVLANMGPQNYDQQRLTLTTINAGTIVLSAVTDSAQLPGSSIILSSRNIQILSSGTSTSQPIVDFTTATFTGCVFRCEIRNTAGTGTTFYGYGVSSGTSHTISGAISGCNYGVSSGTSHTISGAISGCNYGVSSGTSHTISGNVSGCYRGIYTGLSHTISGDISGCTYGFTSGTSHTISGAISGCNYGIYTGTLHTISGTVSGCDRGFSSGTSHTISGDISGCNYGIYSGISQTISGDISGCTYLFRPSIIKNYIITGKTTDFSLYGRNTLGSVYDILIEDVSGVLNTHKRIDSHADIIKTACDGTGDAPSVDPDAGNGYCIEVSNLQSNIEYQPPKIFDFDAMRVWATAGVSKTYTFKCQTTMSTLGTAGRFVLTGSYLDSAVATTRTEVTDESGIAVRSDDTDWSQSVSLTINPLLTGWVSFKLELKYYESGDEVYIWPLPYIT